MDAPPLLPSLARVVRGLSAVFWGLPLAVLAAAKTALGESPRMFPAGMPLGPGDWGRIVGDTVAGCFLSVLAAGLVAFGLRQLVRFQEQERIWIRAVDRASLAALTVLGLLPFAYWWSRFPSQPLFERGVALLFVSGIAFGLALNHLIVRLAAMLPDAILRQDSLLLSRINRTLLTGLLVFSAVDWWLPRGLSRLPGAWVAPLLTLHELRFVVLLLGALIPMALTMTLLWKAKETIVAGVFRNR